MTKILSLKVRRFVSKVRFHQNPFFVRFNGYNYDKSSPQFVSKVRFHHGRHCCCIVMGVEIVSGKEKTGLKRKPKERKTKKKKKRNDMEMKEMKEKKYI